jgi:hypothetical protein
MNNRATTKNKKEVYALKKIVFLIIASILVIGLVLPGCNGGPVTPARPKILIGVPYPYGTIQGDHLLDAAEMAASEINVAGVFVSGENKTYDIDIIGRNDNEISDPANAWIAVNYLVNTANVEFVIGGFRTEAVIPMITNVLAQGFRNAILYLQRIHIRLLRVYVPSHPVQQRLPGRLGFHVFRPTHSGYTKHHGVGLERVCLAPQS